jgi:NTP pyrophosphatase (non-canonical NTP hydrolase)
LNIDEYQSFVEKSNFHREAIQKRLRPVRDLLTLIEAYDYLPMSDLEAEDGVEHGNAMAFRDAVRGLDLIEHDLNLCYAALGLTGEAGEFADKVKKYLRGDDSTVGPNRLNEDGRLAMGKELGDVTWYVTDAANALGTTLQKTVDGNVEKIEDRMARGVRKGDGDNR